MRLTCKIYLIFAVILSTVLGVTIPELIHYYTFYDSSSTVSQSQQMDINIYGLVKLMLIEFSFWFNVSFFSLIFVGLIFSFFSRSRNKLKQSKTYY